MLSSTRNFVRTMGAKMSTAVAAAPEKYAGSVQAMHWLSGGAMMGAVGSVIYCQQTKDKSIKGKLMHFHKSCGTLALFLIAPRLIFRVVTKAPKALSDNAIEKALTTAAHAALYALAIFLPVSGAAMGYYGGKGLPFFFTTIPGAEKADGSIAKPAYKWHKLAGQAIEYLVPLHVGAAFLHVFKGQKIFARIIPGLGK
jgi:cytochrome b561